MDSLSFSEPSALSSNSIESVTVQEQQFLRVASLFLIYISVLGVLIFFVMFLLSGQSVALWLCFSVVLDFVVYGVAFWCSRTLSRVRIGTWLMVCCITVSVGSISFAFGPTQPLPCAYLMPILLSMFWLHWRSTAIIALVCMGLTVVLYGTALLGYQPAIHFDATGTTVFSAIVWLVVLPMPTFIGVYLTRQAKANYAFAVLQTNRLSEALTALVQRQQTSGRISQELSSATAQTATATQQLAQGATEQAAAALQVTTSMEELTETARHIAYNTESVSDAAEDARAIAVDVVAVAVEALQVSDGGQHAVNRAVAGIEIVRDKIATLAQRLTLLNECSRRITVINNTISTLASQTHLLALNAAIESAGAGVQGLRFGVVAAEVKDLADRSLAAATEVRRVMTEVQDAITSAVVAAEEGRLATGGAVVLAHDAGTGIASLQRVVETANLKAQAIVASVDKVVERAGEITLATRQQQTASNQVVVSLRQIGSVAQEAAAASVQMQATTVQVNILAEQLSGNLVNADAEATLIAA